MPSSISANRNSVNRNHMPMKTSFYRFAALLLFAAALTAGCGERTDDMRLLYWNIQNGMWSDQSNGYDNFVAWVKGYDPDVCVWCEAQSIYKSGTAERVDSVDRYLTANWGELAARYGHKYWYVGGHRDNFPQVVTSKYPIENVRRCKHIICYPISYLAYYIS